MADQPTMDELRALVGSQRAWAGKYADAPGSGPSGKTCKTCAFLAYTGNGGTSGHKYYPKCGKTAYTRGDATTIKTGTAACSLYAEKKA